MAWRHVPLFFEFTLFSSINAEQADKAIHQYQYMPFGFSYHKLGNRPPPPISRYNSETSTYETHNYPYTTLPPLRSHLSPFYVLANFYVKFFAWTAHPEKLPGSTRSLITSAQSQGLLDGGERLYCFKKMIELVAQLDDLEFGRFLGGPWNLPPPDDARDLSGGGLIGSCSTPSSSSSSLPSCSSCGSNANAPGDSSAVPPVT